MKANFKLMSLAAVPFVLAACGGNDAETEENTNGNNAAETNNNAAEEPEENEAEENETGNEEAGGGEVEDLAGEYGLEITTAEGSGDAPEASLDELEEAFELISTAKEAEMLEFSASPEAGEAEESGEASGEYAVPGVEMENIESSIMIQFSYELSGDLEDDSVFPSFDEVSEAEASHEGAEFLSWSESQTEAEITGAGTIAEFTSEGSWDLIAEYEGTEISVAEEDSWTAEFSTNTLAGVEEE
ncbi:hypothetical protein [Alkalicoccus halolimnae]|uniref:Uncharacterized protein n=1 Tax=Alkalicoccus halolimnae TaxID=1667239 RepID=A0A5C7FEX1_9BACI|nr:hypothetical protein [Alkalicoccus halolimnae]TXF82723.1 hypothetical protein FTX54_13915 [Alkalicoccus halolimnae]